MPLWQPLQPRAAECINNERNLSVIPVAERFFAFPREDIFGNLVGKGKNEKFNFVQFSAGKQLYFLRAFAKMILSFFWR